MHTPDLAQEARSALVAGGWTTGPFGDFTVTTQAGKVFLDLSLDPSGEPAPRLNAASAALNALRDSGLTAGNGGRSDLQRLADGELLEVHRPE